MSNINLKRLKRKGAFLHDLLAKKANFREETLISDLSEELKIDNVFQKHGLIKGAILDYYKAQKSINAISNISGVEGVNTMRCLEYQLEMRYSNQSIKLENEESFGYKKFLNDTKLKLSENIAKAEKEKEKLTDKGDTDKIDEYIKTLTKLQTNFESYLEADDSDYKRSNEYFKSLLQEGIKSKEFKDWYENSKVDVECDPNKEEDNFLKMIALGIRLAALLVGQQKRFKKGKSSDNGHAISLNR